MYRNRICGTGEARWVEEFAWKNDNSFLISVPSVYSGQEKKTPLRAVMANLCFRLDLFSSS